MNQIHEIDLDDRTVTVGPGINMLKLNEELRRYGYIYPDNPASYPCSLVGGRIGTSGWSLIGGRYGHTRDLVISLRDRPADRRDHPRRRRRRQEDPQVVLRLPAQAPLHGAPGDARHRHRGDARARASARGRVLRLLLLRSYKEGCARRATLARAGLATLAGVVLFDEWKLDYLRRDDEAWIPQPDWVKCVVAVRHVRQRRTRCARAPSG